MLLLYRGYACITCNSCNEVVEMSQQLNRAYKSIVSLKTGQARQLRDTVSRQNPHGRRRALAVEKSSLDDGRDARCLAHLVLLQIEASGKSGNIRRKLADYTYWLRRTGRQAIVELVRSALFVDGGATLRAAAKCPSEAMREVIAAAIVNFVRIVGEHSITATSARALALRCSVSGALADTMLLSVVAGDRTVDLRAASSLATASRIDLLSALQLQQASAPTRAPTPWWQAEDAAPEREHPPGLEATAETSTGLRANHEPAIDMFEASHRSNESEGTPGGRSGISEIDGGSADTEIFSTPPPSDSCSPCIPSDPCSPCDPSTWRAGT